MKMQNAEMEFISFDAQDVIATSGELTFTVAGLGDTVRANATIVTSDGRTIYSAKGYTAQWPNKAAAALKAEIQDENYNGLTAKFYCDSSTSESIANLFGTSVGNGDGTSTKKSNYNGIYKWISESNLFQKIQ